MIRWVRTIFCVIFEWARDVLIHLWSDTVFVARLYSSDSAEIFSDTSEGDLKPILDWEIDLSLAPSFKWNLRSPPQDDLSAGDAPLVGPFGTGLIDCVAFDIGIEIESLGEWTGYVGKWFRSIFLRMFQRRMQYGFAKGKSVDGQDCRVSWLEIDFCVVLSANWNRPEFGGLSFGGHVPLSCVYQK